MTRSPGGPRFRGAGRLLGLLVLAAASLQAYFVLRIAAMAVFDLNSTTFERSEAWRLARPGGTVAWRQAWVDCKAISVNLKRAVVASEDAGYTEHSGVEWDALEKAWERNRRAEAAAETANGNTARRAGAEPKQAARAPRVAKVVGGSTITQQLAKNVFLSSERTLLRKAQELVLAWEMEALLGKRRILELYLNSVEWGEGIFGAEAAAEHYWRLPARSLSPLQAARLAVMLPAPKRFEKRFDTPYIAGRAASIAARMGGVDLP